MTVERLIPNLRAGLTFGDAPSNGLHYLGAQVYRIGFHGHRMEVAQLHRKLLYSSPSELLPRTGFAGNWVSENPLSRLLVNRGKHPPISSLELRARGNLLRNVNSWPRHPCTA